MSVDLGVAHYTDRLVDGYDDPIYSEFHEERCRAHNKHADKPGGSMEMKSWDEPDWLPVLTEELGEVAKEICDHRHGLTTENQYRSQLRKELIQVAAMAAAWITAIDQVS